MRATALALPVLAALLAGCASPGSALPPPTEQEALELLERVMTTTDAVTTDDGLRWVDISTPGVLFVKAPRPHLYRYDALLLDSVVVRYREGQQLDSHQKADLRRYLESRLVAELGADTGWTVVSKPGPTVLRVALRIDDLDAHLGVSSRWGSETAVVRGSGNATFVLDLRDSVSNGPLLRYAQRRVLPGGFFPDVHYAETERVRRAFGVFATDTRQLIATYLMTAQRIREAEQADDTVEADAKP